MRELNEYLERYARQHQGSGGAKTFVAVPPTEHTQVLGFYSISLGAIEFARVPAKLTKKPGRYEVPVFRLGRLAIDRTVQGRGPGATYPSPQADAPWQWPRKWAVWHSQSTRRMSKGRDGTSVPVRCG